MYPPTLEESYNRWIKVIEGTISTCTLKAYAQTGRLFFVWLSTQTYTEGSTFQQQVEDFVIYSRSKLPNGNMPRTINRHLSALRQFSLYMGIPLKVKSQRKGSRESPYITEEEFQMLLQHTKEKPRLLAMIALMYGGGLRLNEVCGLKVEDISSDGYIRVLGKGDKLRFVSVEDEIINMMAPWKRRAARRGIYLFPNVDGSAPQSRVSFQRRIKRLLHTCGIEGKTCHSLRHGGATSLYDLGWDIKNIQEWLGHSRLSTTSIYIHTKPKRQRESLIGLGRFREGGS